MNITKILGLMTHADTINYPNQPAARLHRHLAGEVEKAAAAAGLDADAIEQVVRDTGKLCREPIGPRNAHAVLASLPKDARLELLKTGLMSASTKTTLLPVNLARMLIDVRQNGAADFDVVAVREPTSRWFAGYAVLLRDAADAIISVSLFDANNIKLGAVAAESLPQLNELGPQLKLMRLIEQFGLKGEPEAAFGDDGCARGARYGLRNGEIFRRMDGSYYIKTKTTDVPPELVELAATYALGGFVGAGATIAGNQLIDFEHGTFYVKLGAKPSLQWLETRGKTVDFDSAPLTYLSASPLKAELQLSEHAKLFGLGSLDETAQTAPGQTRYRFERGEIISGASGHRSLTRNDGEAVPPEVMALCEKYNFGFFEGSEAAGACGRRFRFSFGSIELDGRAIVKVVRGGRLIDNP